MSLMNILSPQVKIHIMTGPDALKNASDLQKSLEGERFPYLISFKEIRKGVVMVAEIDPQTSYTIGVLADGVEARDQKWEKMKDGGQVAQGA